MSLHMHNRFDLFPFFEFSVKMSTKRLNIDPDNFIKLIKINRLQLDLYIAVTK